MFTGRVVDVAVSEVNAMQELTFTAVGDPPVQERPKYKFRGRQQPIYYDPSTQEKTRWRIELYRVLGESGITVFPFFRLENTDPITSYGLQLDVVFHMRRRQADYRTYRGTLVISLVWAKTSGRGPCNAGLAIRPR